MACDCSGNCITVYTKELEFLRDTAKSTINDIRDVSSGNIILCQTRGDLLRSCHVHNPMGVSVAGKHVYVTSGSGRKVSPTLHYKAVGDLI
jgi:hypothetical protein